MGDFWVEVDFLGGQSTVIDWLNVPSFVEIEVVVYLNFHVSSLLRRHHHHLPILTTECRTTRRNTIIKNKK